MSILILIITTINNKKNSLFKQERFKPGKVKKNGCILLNSKGWVGGHIKIIHAVLTYGVNLMKCDISMLLRLNDVSKVITMNILI